MKPIRLAVLAAAGVLMCGAVPVTVHARPEPRQVTAVAKQLDELIEWLAKAAKLKTVAPEVADDLTRVLNDLARYGDDIAPEVASIIRRDIDRIPRGALDADLLRLVSKDSTVREGAWALALKAKVREPGARLAQLARDLGSEASTTMGRLAALLDTQDCAVLMRGLSPRTLSRAQVEQITAALRKAELSPTAQGEVFEAVSRAQLSGGALRAQSGLKEGGRVVVGKHNSKHGIDGIGAGQDGRPVIFEFSMYDKKALGPDVDGLVQLSPEWVADRWSKMIAAASSDRLAELKAIGVDSKWLKPITPSEASGWSRKFVVASESALTDANRLAAKLGPNDLMVLGGQ